jgi:hypothetical protein
MIAYRRRPAAGLLLAGSLAVASLAGCSGSPASSSASGASTGGVTSASGSSGSAGSSTAKTVKVCSLLTAPQASTAVGVHYKSATSSLDGSLCTYVPTNAPVPMFVIVSQGSGTVAWKEALATIQEDGEPPRPFSGVGDRAAGGGDQFDVQDGSWIIDVHGGDPNGQGSAFPKSTAVAKVIIAGLH